MKVRLSYILGAALISLASCEPIAEADRFIPVDKTDIDDTMLVRNVLLEDYTGQKCINCPKAHAIIDGLHELHGDKIIPVAIHAGDFAVPDDRKGGLATATGQEYATAHKVESYPSAYISRRGSIIDNIDQWTNGIFKELNKTTDVKIEVSAKLVAANKIEINSKVSSTDKNIQGKYQLWLLENNIVTLQILEDGSKKKDYVHNHVFRAAINGTWGKEMSASKEESWINTIEYSFDAEKCNANELDVVAFVYNNKGVQQVVKVKVTE